jgi:hypothetical protein
MGRYGLHVLLRVIGALGVVAVAAIVNLTVPSLWDTRAPWWIYLLLLVVGVVVQFLIPTSASSRQRGTQSAHNNSVRGSLRQQMSGSGSQKASKNEIDGDFTQEQG